MRVYDLHGENNLPECLHRLQSNSADMIHCATLLLYQNFNVFLPPPATATGSTATWS